jgi:hypothetical protein
MGYLLKSSSTAKPLLFLMVDSGDHLSPKTGLSPTVTLSKNGAAFASPAGAVTELANGWYKVAGNATDTGTVGPLILHATASGADPTDEEYNVVAFDPDSATNLGLSALPTANPAANGGLPTADANNAVKSNLTYILGTVLTETVGGYLAAAFKKLFDVTTPVLTAQSVNQGGDAFARLGAPAGASVSADIAAVGTSAASAASSAGSAASAASSAASSAGQAASDTSTILGRLGAFTGSGLNTVLGFFRAMMRKTAALTPSDVGGSYDNTTDSLEAQQEAGTGGGGLDAAGVRAAVGLATANLDTQLDALPTAAEIVTAILAGTADGIAVSTVLARLNAFTRGHRSVTNNGNGTYTIAVKAEDNTTTLFSITFNPTTGAVT